MGQKIKRLKMIFFDFCIKGPYVLKKEMPLCIYRFLLPTENYRSANPKCLMSLAKYELINY